MYLCIYLFIYYLQNVCYIVAHCAAIYFNPSTPPAVVCTEREVCGDEQSKKPTFKSMNMSETFMGALTLDLLFFLSNILQNIKQNI